MKKYILGLVLLLAVAISAQERAPKVKTELGLICGVQEDGVDSFKEIPFAAPPVVEFCWRAPQPLAAWEGELDATEYGANCAQSGWGGEPGTISEGSSKDFLYLNVRKPSDVYANAGLPVMIWIHGGGFVGGNGSGASENL